MALIHLYVPLRRFKPYRERLGELSFESEIEKKFSWPFSFAVGQTKTACPPKPCAKEGRRRMVSDPVPTARRKYYADLRYPAGSPPSFSSRYARMEINSPHRGDWNTRLTQRGRERSESREARGRRSRLCFSVVLSRSRS